jgi:hypothetical protein
MYRIEFPDGRTETAEMHDGLTHAVIVQAKPGEAWTPWDGYQTRVDAANEAAYLEGRPTWHAAQVVPIAAA